MLVCNAARFADDTTEPVMVFSTAFELLMGKPPRPAVR